MAKYKCKLLICSKKNTGLQGSTLSSPHMTTGFGPFDLPNLVVPEWSFYEYYNFHVLECVDDSRKF